MTAFKESDLMKKISKIARKYFVYMMGFFIVSSFCLILLGNYLSNQGYFAFLSLALTNIGMSIFIASTVGFGLSQFSKVVNESPSELLDELRIAEVTGFYANRKEPAANADILKKLRNTKEGTIGMLGSTLRVFFNGNQEFYDTICESACQNRDVKFQVLILDPNSREAIQRSQAETSDPFEDYGDYLERSVQFQESKTTKANILDLNQLKCKDCKRCEKCEKLQECKLNPKEFKGKRPLCKPIDLKYYHMSPYCFLLMFSDECYVSQYIYGEKPMKKSTTELPLIKFSAKSKAYERLKWHFDYVWINAKDPDTISAKIDALKQNPKGSLKEIFDELRTQKKP